MGIHFTLASSLSARPHGQIDFRLALPKKRDLATPLYALITQNPRFSRSPTDWKQQHAIPSTTNLQHHASWSLSMRAWPRSTRPTSGCCRSSCCR
jgi:hypothetical protein